MNAIQKTICASLVLAGLANGGAIRAADVAREFAVGVNEANTKLQAGDIEGALQQYSAVRTLQPESADLSYNMAVAQYRKGDVAAAEPLFQAAATSENDSLAAKARYNLGNCDYAAGVELSPKDRPAAIEQLESAISNYRSSLEVDANNADARANIELAAQLIEKLREEQKQQEQQQDQQDQEQNTDQQSENQQQNSEQQNQDQQKSEQEQKKQDSQSQSSQGGEQQDEQQQQEQESKQNDSQSKSEQQQDQAKQHEQESERQDQSKDSAQRQPQNQQSQSSQQRDEQQSKQQQQPQPNQDASATEEAEEKKGQQQPQGELTTASEEEAKQNREQKPIAAFDPAKDGEMTQQEAEKMLQAIRDRDMLRRYNRQRDELQRHVPVDKDW